MPRFPNSNERSPRAPASRAMVLTLLILLLAVTACSKGPSEHLGPAAEAVTPEAAVGSTAVHTGSTKGTTLQGLLWQDHDGDGRFGTADTVLPETRLFLDLNGNGVLDDFEPTAVTDGVGQYRFSNLVPGISYTLHSSADVRFSALALEAGDGQDIQHFTW